MKIAAASIASNRRMALVRATARSLAAHHPELPFFALQADTPHPAIDPAGEPFRLIPLADLRPAVRRWLHFGYSEMELSYALTPFLLRHLLAAGFDAVLFLKQETMVLERLDPLFEQLERHTILLTPHLLTPPRGRDGRRRERNVLRAGIFNGGVIAVRRTEETLALLEWWEQKCTRDCVLDVDHGLHYEQRWLDFFPSLAPNLGIVRDPGVNVGHWNLRERCIQASGGRVLACGQPCRIFRFSGYNPAQPDIVSRYAPEFRVENAGAAAEVFRRYQRLLEECGWRDMASLPYGWNCFENGETITPADRRAWRQLGAAAEKFGNPFATGPGTFHSWRRTRHGLLQARGMHG